jgi:hypothetical protein
MSDVNLALEHPAEHFHRRGNAVIESDDPDNEGKRPDQRADQARIVMARDRGGRRGRSDCAKPDGGPGEQTGEGERGDRAREFLCRHAENDVSCKLPRDLDANRLEA